jgi:hypothetical protein
LELGLFQRLALWWVSWRLLCWHGCPHVTQCRHPAHGFGLGVLNCFDQGSASRSSVTPWRGRSLNSGGGLGFKSARGDQTGVPGLSRRKLRPDRIPKIRQQNWRGRETRESKGAACSRSQTRSVLSVLPDTVTLPSQRSTIAWSRCATVTENVHTSRTNAPRRGKSSVFDVQPHSR